MNHMILGFNDDDSERLNRIEDEEIECFFCLREMDKEEVKHLNVIGKQVQCCPSCYYHNKLNQK